VVYIQDPTAPLDVASATPSSDFERVGSFRYLIADDRWEWSDSVARMHGYHPGTVTPTTELILSHKHPDDKPAVAEIIGQVLRHGAPFSSRHRIIDTMGNIRVVVVVGERLTTPNGQVIGTTGFYIDITDAFDADVQRTVSDRIATIEANRAIINQAIGVVMWTYGVSAERAFDVLAWRSKETNVKLRRIAEQFLRDLSAIPPSSQVRADVDRALLTAHERVAD
jgi:PAS domain S-box-containing protein